MKFIILTAGLFLFSHVSAAGEWSPAGNMNIARSNPLMAKLNNGKILVFGDYPISAELFDPKTNTWSTLTSRPHWEHLQSQIIVLKNGNVLALGGQSLDTKRLDEKYDPVTDQWTYISTPKVSRWGHTATLLQNGLVLVVGGFNKYGITDNVEIYDPTQDKWTTTVSLPKALKLHTASLLPDGNVLISGGRTDDISNSNRSFIYDYQNKTWKLGPKLLQARSGHVATTLNNGQILITGGASSFNPLTTAELAELYDPKTNIWKPAGKLITPHYAHTASLLVNGKVMVAGGVGGGKSLNQSEIYDPASNTWSASSNLSQDRYAHQAITLADERVLVVGGIQIIKDSKGQSNSLKSTEIFKDEPVKVEDPRLVQISNYLSFQKSNNEKIAALQTRVSEIQTLNAQDSVNIESLKSQIATQTDRNKLNLLYDKLANAYQSQRQSFTTRQTEIRSISNQIKTFEQDNQQLKNRIDGIAAENNKNLKNLNEQLSYLTQDYEMGNQSLNEILTDQDMKLLSIDRKIKNIELDRNKDTRPEIVKIINDELAKLMTDRNNILESNKNKILRYTEGKKQLEEKLKQQSAALQDAIALNQKAAESQWLVNDSSVKIAVAARIYMSQLLTETQRNLESMRQNGNGNAIQLCQKLKDDLLKLTTPAEKDSCAPIVKTINEAGETVCLPKMRSGEVLFVDGRKEAVSIAKKTMITPVTSFSCIAGKVSEVPLK